MKMISMLIVLLAAFPVFSSPLKIVPAPLDTIYVPMGFDTNDNAQVVLTGHFPNLCYKSPQAKADVQGNVVTIDLKASFSSEAACAEMIVPFIQVVDLGPLKRGTYQVNVNLGTPTAQQSEITVTESTSNSIDDFIYANVEYVEKTFNSRTITLNGHNPSDCLVLEEVKFISNGSNTLSVLPIMKQVSDFCPMKMIPFRYEVEVPAMNGNNVSLLHVRVMDGRSVNTLFPNYKTH